MDATVGLRDFRFLKPMVGTDGRDAPEAYRIPRRARQWRRWDERMRRKLVVVFSVDGVACGRVWISPNFIVAWIWTCSVATFATE